MIELAFLYVETRHRALKRGEFCVNDDGKRWIYNRRGWRLSIGQCRALVQGAWENKFRDGKIRGRYPNYEFK
jgi:hypothetical protein